MNKTGFQKGHKGFVTKEGYMRSAEKHRAHPNRGTFKKGLVPWNKGVPISLETKAKMTSKLKGRKVWNKGKKFSEESRRKMSIAKTGDKSPKWKGGISKMRSYKRMMKIAFLKRKLEVGGMHTKEQWEILKAQYNWTCPCCGRSEPQIKLTGDHIIPISKGGSDNIENIQPLCKSCNSKKHTKIIEYKAQQFHKN